jgi:chromosome segregation ATPase
MLGLLVAEGPLPLGFSALCFPQIPSQALRCFKLSQQKQDGLPVGSDLYHKTHRLGALGSIGKKIVKTLLGKIASSLDGPLDLVVFIGSGFSVEWSDFATLNPKRWVWVEGDPEAAERLNLQLAGRDSCSVLPVLVTPNGAKSSFYRYNLSFLNGTLPLGEMQSLYPRLKIVEERELPSQTLSTLLATIPLSGQGKRLLILDLPGQEAALLESVVPDQLQVFDWIIIRGCRKALQEGAQSMEASRARLDGALFEKIMSDEVSDPFWPLGLFHFDRRMTVLLKELENRTQLLVEKVAENDRQTQRLEDLEVQLKLSREKLDAARQQLGEKNQRIEAVETARTELENRLQLLVEKENEANQLAQRIAELETQLNSRAGELEAARQQLGELNQRIEAVESARTEALREAGDREAAAKAELENQIRVASEKATEHEQKTLQIAELQEQLKSDREKLNAMRLQLGEKIQRIEEIESLKTAALREAGDREAAAKAELQNQIRVASEKAAEHERKALQLAELQEQLKASQEKLDVARQQLGEKNQRLEAIEAARTTALKEAADREASISAELEKRAQILVEKANESYLQTHRIAELEAQLNSRTGELDAAQQQLGVLHQRIQAVESAKTEALKEAADREAVARAELANRAQLMRAKAVENEQKTQLVAELETQLNCRADELNAARQQLGELKQRIEAAESARSEALKEATDREAAAKAELDNQARLVSEKAAENQQKTLQLAELQEQLKSRTDELNAARQELGELNQRIKALESAGAAAKAELEKQVQIASEKASENEQQTLQLAELGTHLQSVREKLDAARQQLGEKNQRIEAVEVAKTKALKEAADRESAAGAELEKRARLLVEKANETRQQALRLADLETQIKSSRGELEEKRRQFGELNRQLEERSAEIGSAHKRLASLETEMVSQKTLIELLGKGRAQQEKLYQEKAQELDTLRGKIEQLNSRNLELEGLLAAQENQGRLIGNEFQKVEGQIDLIKEIFLREKIR